MSEDDLSPDELLEQLLELFGRRRNGEIHTHEVGEVTSYDPNGPSVTVQLVNKQRKSDGRQDFFESKAAIPNIPVSFPIGGNYAIVWPVQPGDEVGLHIFSRSYKLWQELGGREHEPEEYRRFSLGDSYAYVGLSPEGGDLSKVASERHLKLTRIDESQQIVLRDDGDIHIKDHTGDIVLDTPNKVRNGSKTAAKALALAQRVESELDDLWSSLEGHSHANAGASTASGSAGDVSAKHATDEIP